MPDSFSYRPEAFESDRYSWWEARGFFRADSAANQGAVQTLVLPPIRLTGPIHLGHAFNLTLQDAWVRWRRMEGEAVSMLPGFNHGGVVARWNALRELEQPQAELLDVLHEWTFDQRDVIREQMRGLGLACSWERETWSLDSSMDLAVNEAFVSLHEQGMVESRQDFVPWCTQCGTALSPEELRVRRRTCDRWFLRFRIKGGKKKDYVSVATRRPELLFGVAALAANTRDERYASLLNQPLEHPLLERDVPVVPDDLSDPEAGTGLEMLVPAHFGRDRDRLDRYEMEGVLVYDEEGCMTGAAGRFAGMERLACRQELVEELADMRLIEKQDQVIVPLRHCPGCDAVVEPRFCRQWFIDLKASARGCVEQLQEDAVSFVPSSWNHEFIEDLGKLKPWCVSRQMAWGRRIPAWHCEACGKPCVGREAPSRCATCGQRKFVEQEDVFDSWFVSALWPLVVMGWPDRACLESETWPTPLATCSADYAEIWMSRMMLLGHHFSGVIPFRRALLHGTVRDDSGRRQRKGLADAVDPRSFVATWGADSLRLALVRQAETGKDISIDAEALEAGQAFCQQVCREVGRFVDLGGSHDTAFDGGRLSIDDRYLLQYLNRAILACSDNLGKFRFSAYVSGLMDFTTSKFFDSYLDYAIPILRRGSERDRIHVARVTAYAWRDVLRMLNPVAPFVAEECWHFIGFGSSGASISDARWPKVPEADEAEWTISTAELEYMDARQDLVRVAQELQENYRGDGKQKPHIIVRPKNDRHLDAMQSEQETLRTLLDSETLEIDPDFLEGEAITSARSKLGEVYLPLSGYIDIEETREEIEAELGVLRQDLERISLKLENIDFISKAPEEVIQQHQERRRDLLEQRDKLVRKLASLE